MSFIGQMIPSGFDIVIGCLLQARLCARHCRHKYTQKKRQWWLRWETQWSSVGSQKACHHHKASRVLSLVSACLLDSQTMLSRSKYYICMKRQHWSPPLVSMQLCLYPDSCWQIRQEVYPRVLESFLPRKPNQMRLWKRKVSSLKEKFWGILGAWAEDSCVPLTTSWASESLFIQYLDVGNLEKDTPLSW